MSSNWKEYFTFSRKERVIALSAGFLLILLILFPYFYQPQEPLLRPDYAWEQEIDSLLKFGEVTNETGSTNPDAKIPKRRFYFDPNVIGLEEWMLLGLSEKTANTVINYRNKGGKFRKPDDLLKIWGMDPLLAKEIIPFVRIAGAFQEKNYTHSQHQIVQSPSFIDINKATQDDWKSLPGIGEVLSSRIIKFRERLGGFARIEQVAETYGLPDSVFKKVRNRLKCNSAGIQKLSVMEADEATLSTHPYISRSLARAWVQARVGWTSPVSQEQLLQVRGMDLVLLERLMPYLSWE